MYNFDIIKGDIFDYIGNVDAVCITTNGTIKKNGELVMGAGVAKAFYDRYIDKINIAKRLADKLIAGAQLSKDFTGTVEQKYNICFRCVTAEENNGTHIVSFPTKNHFKNNSSLELIERNAIRLRWFADHYKLNSIVLPSPGTGLGKLSKEEVYQILNKYFDHRFFIITK